MHPAPSRSLLDALAVDPNARVRLSVATNAGTTDRMRESLLRALSADTDDEVRRTIAQDESCPEDVLRVLASDAHAWVRGGVAGNPAASIALLRSLASDDADWVQENLAGNPSTPSDLFDAGARASEQRPLATHESTRTRSCFSWRSSPS